jgi:plastocyanin
MYTTNMRKGKLAFLMSVLLVSIMTLAQSTSAEENKTHNVDIVFGSGDVENGRFYNPQTVKIQIGDSISWMNLDKDPHTVTDGTPKTKWGTVFNSGLMRQGKEFKFTFTKPGEYPYLCALHPWMSGKVIVEDPLANSVPSDLNVFQKLNVFIKTEKQSYEQNEIIRFTVEIMGAGNKPTDPDFIDAQFGAEEPVAVKLSRLDVGKYVYSTTDLKPASYNLNVKVSKDSFVSGSSMLTVHVLKAEPVKEIPKPEESSVYIEADQKLYYAGDLITINGFMPRISENKSVVLQVFDAKDRLYTRGQVQVNSETFAWSFKVPDTAIAGTWTVKTKNFDEIVTTSFEIANPNAVEKPSQKTEVGKPAPLVSVPVMKFKEEKVTIVQSSITDQLNSQLYGVNKGQSVMLQSVIKNNQDTEQTFAYIVQIKDSNGIIVKLEAVEGVLPAGKSFTVGALWIPNKTDSYATEVFVWKSLSEPVPLSLNLISTRVNVTD